jgi:hypothetical protein
MSQQDKFNHHKKKYKHNKNYKSSNNNDDHHYDVYRKQKDFKMKKRFLKENDYHIDDYDSEEEN